MLQKNLPFRKQIKKIEIKILSILRDDDKKIAMKKTKFSSFINYCQKCYFYE